MFYVGNSVLVTLVTSASAFTTLPLLHFTGHGPTFVPKLTTSQLSASITPITPAAEPAVFLQNRIAEPKDAESVPAAASILSSTFPEEPFVLQYRTDTGYLAAQEKRPVLDLSDLKKIEIVDDGKLIKVNAGVTVGKLAEMLTHLDQQSLFHLKELFMVLPGDNTLSVVEASLHEENKQLRSAIVELHAVDKDGNINSKQLDDINEEEDIIVDIVLASPSPKLHTISGRWYTRLLNKTPIDENFVTSLPDVAKLMVFKSGNFNNIAQVIVFVDGDEDLGLPSDEWDMTDATTPEQRWRLFNDLSKTARFDALTASGVLDVSSKRPSLEEIVDVLSKQENQILVTLEKGEIRASFDAEYPPDVDDVTQKLFKFDDNSAKIIAPAGRPKPLMKKFATGVTPIALLGTKIEGFKGEIFDGVRGGLSKKRQQYATSSYDNMMNPTVIAYPTDEEDVALAIKYATSPEFTDARKKVPPYSGYPFKVMGRGGGHQYCGVSCDNDAFILSMDQFNKIERREVYLEGVTGPDGKPHTVTTEVHVGTGNRLKEVATYFNTDPKTQKLAKGSNDSFGVTIPHGECPAVGIGGHSQTGGYGHIARNFGLAVDYLYGFTIVTANGEIRTITRDSPDQADKNLYWAVLGGSPGAFGVTTNLIFHPLQDKDYPHSTGFEGVCIYSDENMRLVLDILEDFINRAKETDENAIAEGLDLMVSLSSNNSNLVQPGLDPSKGSIAQKLSSIVLELECRDMTDAKAYGQMQEIMDTYNKGVQMKVPAILDGKSHYKLSEMSLHFTRKPPGVTSSGREHWQPYRKASYGSKDKLTPGWSKSFTDLLSDVVATKDDIACVFQVVVGGGAHTRFGKAGLNAIAHRDAQLHGLVFDLFRGQDDDSLAAAQEFSRRFEHDVVNKHQTAHPHVMAQWASHGDLDMNKKHVWEKYFDNPVSYDRLRSIKKEVDPDDVFHSRFTVRPADTPQKTKRSGLFSKLKSLFCD